ncbi:hypothetical protein C0Q70_14257 [Pomacea canaliculata]|uniref:Uncharacterized protein n=1 Tax=Pomacea canaliculata TaxID=400727 RepID=A0A2T7NZJ1_POMCA|nr:hypothetical protein C0Q70_14257 [Pomacea canaliculata]
MPHMVQLAGDKVTSEGCGCFSRREMADNGGGDRSIKTTPPSLSSPHALSISAQGVASEQKMAAGATSTLTREPEQQQEQQQQQQQRDNVKMGMSPASKGFYQRRGSADRHRVPENNFGGGPDGDEDDDTVVARGRTLLSRQDNDNCNGSEGRNGSQRRPGGRLRVQDQDGPLDFSVRRRESVSESFTDDSRASSSLSPTNFAGGTGSPSAHGSPEFDGLFPHHHSSSSDVAMAMQQQGVATSVLDHGRARPSVSDESELVGQPRTVPLAATRRLTFTQLLLCWTPPVQWRFRQVCIFIVTIIVISRSGSCCSSGTFEPERRHAGTVK